ENGQAYLVMECLDGETLARRIDRLGKLAEVDVVQIARQIAGTLAAAHAKGIIHRDLKPDNVFLVPDPVAPGRERTKIGDFGAAQLTADSLPSQTRTGSLIGSPSYMAPEQCRGRTDIDARADEYALGCVMFEMAAGRPPFDSELTGDVLAAHITQ